jgi:poly-gamma-glutamate synthesis protein (capsule biosynthesis protein)
MSRKLKFLLIAIIIMLTIAMVTIRGINATPPAKSVDNTSVAKVDSATEVSPPLSKDLLLQISPAVPSQLQDKFRNLGFQITNGGEQSENLYLDVAQSAPDAQHVSTWVYALVSPFPTLIDGVSTQELLSAWRGSPSGVFTKTPLLVEESTLKTFTSLWGEPASNAVQVVDAGELHNMAWNTMTAWAIIPFEQIKPTWKVLMIDGQSPIQKSFDPAAYPLTVSYQLICVNPCQLPIEQKLSFRNYDPGKLTTVILTGVTALVRITAKKMDTKGITYPAEEIGDLLREADILHINNEAPFYGGCPEPDPHKPKLTFCSRPRYIELLTDIGTDVIELSGDHFADYDETAMYETFDIYDQYNIPYYGGGRNVGEGKKPLLLEVNGNKLMFIGCGYKTIYSSATDTKPGAVPCDFDYMVEQIKIYRSQGYLPIVTFQYNEFDTPEARPQQVLDFRVMAEAGAVIVSGSQAHVSQVMEFHQDAFIHYGLGNLFFDQMSVNLTRRAFLDRHVFYDGRYLGVELITTFLEDYARPRYMTEAERTQFLTEYFVKSGWNFQQIAP